MNTGFNTHPFTLTQCFRSLHYFKEDSNKKANGSGNKAGTDGVLRVCVNKHLLEKSLWHNILPGCYGSQGRDNED